MQKSDITFDFMASSQLREEAPKKLKSCNKVFISWGTVVGQDPFMRPGALMLRSESSLPV